MDYIKNTNKVHFIGIGGISMCALAKLMLHMGKTVSGSDEVFGKNMEELLEAGADVWCGVFPEKVAGADLVVYSSAIKPDNGELVFARGLGITCLERMDFLGAVGRLYNNVIAVAGTHGKTTITAMLAEIFLAAHMQFTAHIGGYPVGRSNLIASGGDLFLTEACEYKQSFLKLNPTMGIITNVEFDHPDTYHSEEELFSAFDAFSARCSSGIAICKDCKYFHACKCDAKHMLTFGKDASCAFSATDVHMMKYGCFGFSVCEYGMPKCQIELSIAGAHNVQNALMAYGVAIKNGVLSEVAIKALQNFKGVQRRFESKGVFNGAQIVLDYAHHPSELAAGIATARSIKIGGRVIIAFQPHTYSRTKALLNEFIYALALADVVYIYKEYPARETPDMGASAKDLYDGLSAIKSNCYYYSAMLPLAGDIKSDLSFGDVLLIAGAGDIELLADIIL